MESLATAATEERTAEDALREVRAAVEAVAPWPERVEVCERDKFAPRLLMKRGYQDSAPWYTLTEAEEAKARHILNAVREQLKNEPHRLARTPDLLLVISTGAVVSIWDYTVRQAAGE